VNLRSRLLVAAIAFAAPAVHAQPASRTDTSFAALVARLSEPGGYFDSDNIITNEASYLHVSSQLAKAHVQGGIYMGVGPDQNFSYIALIKPQVAVLIDIRRDNLLEHLLFKSLFTLARNRAEYLCLLLGRPVPVDVERWTGKPMAEIISYLALTPMSDTALASTRKRSDERIASFGVPLDARDRQVLERYRAEFARSGLDTRYSSLGRDNRLDYPSFAQLITATDRAGKQIGYLADETAFQYVRSMQLRNRIIPVTGNVAGPKAVRAIAQYAAEQGLHVSAFYLSNVEQYLMGRDGGFDDFARNVERLPRDSASVIIRSYFGRFGPTHPLYVPSAGNRSTSMAETIDSFVRRYAGGQIASYSDLVFSGYIPP
jgi:hypothetical protein